MIAAWLSSSSAVAPEGQGGSEPRDFDIQVHDARRRGIGIDGRIGPLAQGYHYAIAFRIALGRRAGSGGELRDQLAHAIGFKYLVRLERAGRGIAGDRLGFATWRHGHAAGQRIEAIAGVQHADGEPLQLAHGSGWSTLDEGNAAAADDLPQPAIARHDDG